MNKEEIFGMYMKLSRLIILSWLLSNVHNNAMKPQVQEPQVYLDTFDTLVQKSRNFGATIEFKTENNRIENLGTTDELKIDIARHAMHAYPVVHEKVLRLIDGFLNFKKQHGTTIEKEFYNGQYCDSISYINRLIKKRPVVFYDHIDKTTERDGGICCPGKSHLIGTDAAAAASLYDYISYDEMALGAFIGISSPTYCINNVSRKNFGRKDEDNTYINKIIFVGIVGARFERAGRMECEHMLVSPSNGKKQEGLNTIKPEHYGFYATYNHVNPLTIWKKFYNNYTFPTYAEAQKQAEECVNGMGRFCPINNGASYLDNWIYKERMRITLLTFLTEAQKRGTQYGQQVYVHLSGLGLGKTWSKHPQQQGHIMREICADLLKKYKFPNITDLDLAYWPDCAGDSKTELENGKINSSDSSWYFEADEYRVKIHWSQNAPAQNTEDKQDKLIVASYAWDSNAFPGNEYYVGALDQSDDPAAASGSTIAELHNCEINDEYITAENLRICTDDAQEISVDEYRKRKEQMIAQDSPNLPSVIDPVDNNAEILVNNAGTDNNASDTSDDDEPSGELPKEVVDAVNDSVQKGYDKACKAQKEFEDKYTQARPLAENDSDNEDEKRVNENVNDSDALSPDDWQKIKGLYAELGSDQEGADQQIDAEKNLDELTKKSTGQTAPSNTGNMPDADNKVIDISNPDSAANKLLGEQMSQDLKRLVEEERIKKLNQNPASNNNIKGSASDVGQTIPSTKNFRPFPWLPSIFIWPFNRNNKNDEKMPVGVGPAFSIDQQLNNSARNVNQMLAQKFPQEYPNTKLGPNTNNSTASRFTYSNVFKGCLGIGVLGLGAAYAYIKLMKSQATPPAGTGSWYTSFYNKWIYKQS